ncbi:pentapeptide repeat-containing protein [Corynebacterium sp. P5848]|uniref:pentapeptide repeat-containing protein n=1 Tax=Corynebacterium marambiense TaxID=2765364 RepID=UPI002260D7D7|nr:pentapeptide repeat-containing protein [Corynebacterium marambiense]MCX7543011.1 pentapeptide repeat-containing protein [Corynebacterium marambiense]
MGENNRTNVGTDGEATETTELRENFRTVDGIPDSYPRIVRGAIWLVAMLFRLVALPLRPLLRGLERLCSTDADAESEQSTKSVSAGDGGGSGGEPPRYIPRWRTIRNRQQIATIAVFLVLPVALIGEGWGALWKGLGSGPAWQWILVGLAVAVVLVWLSVWLTELVPEPGKRCKHGDGGSGADVPNKAPYAEMLFVLLAVLALAAGVRVILISDLERTVQLAAGLFAAGGVALSVWATQRRSLDQQEREDKRQHDRLVRESVLQDDRLRREAELQNERLESESLRDSRQLSVQQRLDMSKKLQVSIEHLGSEQPVVRAAAVSELMFQIDDWNALTSAEIQELSKSDDEGKVEIQHLKAEGLRRRQELFDLAMKDYAPTLSDTAEGQENSGELRLRGAVTEARRRGLKSAQRGSFGQISFAGIALPDPDAKDPVKEWGEVTKWRKTQIGAYLVGANLRGARLDGADLRGAWLAGADLRWADLVGADLRGARLAGANLRGAHLVGVNLWGAYLAGADLRGACLEGANLLEAHLEGANLLEAHLEGAKLAVKDQDRLLIRPCTFDEKTKWLGASYIPSTIFPEGFDPEDHGMILLDYPVFEKTPDAND